MIISTNITLENIFICFISFFALLTPIGKIPANSMLVLSVISGLAIFKKYRADSKKNEKNDLVQRVFIFFLVILFTMLFSTNKLHSLHEFIRLFTYVLPFFIFVLLRKIKNRFYMNTAPIFTAFLVGSTVASLYGIYQYVTQKHLFITAFYNHHAIFGSFLEVSVPLIFALFISSDYLKHRLAYLGVGIVNIMALILTQARGPWIGALIGLVLVLALFRHRIAINKKFVLIGLAVCILVVILAAPLYIHRAETLVDPTWHSNYVRLFIWHSTLQMIHDYPIMGVGLGQFINIYNPYYLNPLSPERFHNHAHNSYLMMTSECGVLGLVAFLYLMHGIAKLLWRAFKDNPSNPYIIGCMGGIVAILVNSFVDSVFWASYISKIIWLFLGLIYYDQICSSKR